MTMRNIIHLAISALVVSTALPSIALAMDTPPSTPGGGGGDGHPGSGSPASVPEPGMLGLIGGGVVALAVARRVRRKR